MINSELPKAKREKILNSISISNSNNKYEKNIILSSYTLVTNMIDSFSFSNISNGRRFIYDYCILDEGHIIKNPSTKLYKAMHRLPTYHRIIMTGTPIQNNLIEFWALMNWVTDSTVFGSKQEFITAYSTPIVDGQNPRASEDAVEAG